MHIKDLFESKKVVFSFEIFPPKPTSPVDTVYSAIESISKLKPDFISVTYGAGGSATSNRTEELSSLVKNNFGIETVAHLTCISSSREFIAKTLSSLREKGIENILALRGDIPENQRTSGDFNRASELIEFIKSNCDFGISAACYPEGHIESKSLSQDVEAVKAKVDAGAQHLISQLFFDNNYFYNLLNLLEAKGIYVPVEAGIMPITNKKQIERVVSLCGATLPPKFVRIMEKYEHDTEALRDAGIAYAVDQIVDLISSGVRGIHLYTMNNPYVAAKITESISSILISSNKKEAV